MLITEIQESIQSRIEEAIRSGAFREYSGRFTQQLEEDLTRLFRASTCQLMSSGTAALEVALRAAGVAPGDRVVLSAYDYPGNFWAIERVGARPLLIDTEPDSWNISLPSLSRVLEAQASPCRALIVSHLHGALQQSERLRAMCDAAGMILIEDCCQAIGAQQADGLPVGHQADFAILSFGGGKTISAGRGGALLCRDPVLGQRAKLAGGAGSGPYQLSELQAAVVLAQLAYLDQINAATRRYFAQLAAELADEYPEWSWQMPSEGMRDRTAYYQAGWLVEPNRQNTSGGFQQSPEQLIASLRARGIPAGAGFKGFHRRSARRCDLPAPLTHTAQVVEQTLVVHHRIALPGVSKA